ncbi:MAG: ABC transporter permease subunit [Aerococcus sp.]|nr:ABC transporter permease subunit [Aerococcus sp.]
MKSMLKKGQAFLFMSVIGVVIFLPLLLLGVWSVTARWPWPNLLPTSWTARGWLQLQLEGRELTHVLGGNLILSIGVSVVALVIAVMTAKVYVTQSKHKQRLIRLLVILPLLVPATVFGMGIHPLFIRLQLANTLVGVGIGHLLYSLPYAQLLVMNAYAGEIPRLEEQAMLLGASPLTVLWSITLPLLAPVLLVGFIMGYIVSFSQYFLTQLLGGGVIQTLATRIFPYLQANDRTIASVYSLIFLALTLVIFWIADYAAKRMTNPSYRKGQL